MTAERPTPAKRGRTMPNEYRCLDSWNVPVVSAKWADAKIASLKRQRDELREALEDFVRYVAQGVPIDPECNLMDEARAAIAEATGET